nr:hypothetical protein OG409_08840 [Streptomyces sp. NBC_00974]
MRGLTQRLDPGAGWYGEFLRRDPEGMRACLDGAAMPPWDVLESLLGDLAAAAGGPGSQGSIPAGSSGRSAGPGGPAGRAGTADPAGPVDAGALAREAWYAAGLRAAAVEVWDRLPGGVEELSTLLAAADAQRAQAQTMLRGLSVRLAETADPGMADALAGEISWTRDDAARAAARHEDLTARLAAVAPAGRPESRADVPGQREQAPVGRAEGRWLRGAKRSGGARYAGAAVPEDQAFALPPDDPSSRTPLRGARFGRPARTGADPAVASASAPAPGSAPASGSAPAPVPEASSGPPVRNLRFGRSARQAPDRAPAPESARAPDLGPYLRADAAPAPDAGRYPTAAPATYPAPGTRPGGTGSQGAGTGAGAGMDRETAMSAGEGEGEGAHGGTGPSWTGPPVWAGAARPGRRGEGPAGGLVDALIALRAQGRSGEAHALLCEAAAGPAERLPGLGEELGRAGLGADWATLLWEAASLPPAGFAAAAAALGPADCEALLRQGVARPAAEIAEAALVLGGAGRSREADTLLGAFVRVRTAEEAARLARRDPGWFAPRLLRAAEALSGSHHRDVLHALRVAKLPVS